MAWLKDSDMESFRQNQKAPTVNEPKATAKEFPPLEFNGEYLGGHPALSGKRKVKLKLEEEKLLVCPPEFKSSFLGRFDRAALPVDPIFLYF